MSSAKHGQASRKDSKETAAGKSGAPHSLNGRVRRVSFMDVWGNVCWRTDRCEGLPVVSVTRGDPGIKGLPARSQPLGIRNLFPFKERVP